MKILSQYQEIFLIFVRKLHSEQALSPVVIADGGRESSSTDPVAHHMDPFTEPELNPKNTQDEEGTTSMRKTLRYLI